MRKLRKYQKRIFKQARNKKRVALFLEMRLGKTILTVRLLKNYPINKILIVCPFSAFQSWRNELRDEGEGLPVELIGTKQERLDRLFNNKDKRWYIINKEGHLAIGSVLKQLDWDGIVLDESTFIKNPKTKVSKFFTNNFRNVPYRFILTGTPAPESPLNYFPQMKFLSDNLFKEESYWEFRHKHFHQVGYDYILKASSKNYVQQKVSLVSHFLSRKDADLGGVKIYEQKLVQLTDKAQNFYNQLCEEFLVEINNKIENKTKWITSQFILLRRLLGGYINDRLVFKGKLLLLKELLSESLSGEQVIIWCSFIDEIKLLLQEIPNSDVIYGNVKQKVRQRRINLFNQGKIRVLIIQPETMKFGADLSGSDISIYYSTPLSLETRLQSEDRIVRTDKESVLIIDLIVDNTIDEDIIDSLLKKEGRSKMMEKTIKNLKRSK